MLAVEHHAEVNGERNAPNAKIITSLAVELAGFVGVRSMTVHGDINDNYKTIFPAEKSERAYCAPTFYSQICNINDSGRIYDVSEIWQPAPAPARASHRRG